MPTRLMRNHYYVGAQAQEGRYLGRRQVRLEGGRLAGRNVQRIDWLGCRGMRYVWVVTIY